MPPAVSGGRRRPGQTQEQGGQAGGMSICGDKPLGDPRLILYAAAAPGLWLVRRAAIAAGGASYGRIAEAIGQ